jgi:hypothetical protein
MRLLHASAALLVYERFDYPALSMLDGASANALNLVGTYVSEANAPILQLRLSEPGLSYGNLTALPAYQGRS